MSSTSISNYVCRICGYHATGFHYGVLACNACRAFFRRTILRDNEDPYECGFEGNCVVIYLNGGLKNITACQACRFQKCIELGMKPEGVTKPSTSNSSVTTPPSEVSRPHNVSTRVPVIADDTILRSTRTISTSYLTEMYELCRRYSESGVEIPSADAYVIQNNWTTYVQAFHNVLQVEVMSMVEWAKRIPGFTDLYIEDQLTLLRAGARRHAYLRWVYQTACSNEKEVVHIILRDHVKAPVRFGSLQIKGSDGVHPKYCEGTFSGLREVAKQLRDWDITEQEFLCFKALILLDPNTKGLCDRKKVLRLRQNIQMLIVSENAINPSLTHRILDLHLLISPVDSLSYNSAMAIRKNNFFAVLSKVAKLLEDLILIPVIQQ